ncbi:MAG TPA: lipoyl(octanoyl) transferase LipB [Candidatus Marinimicrobia bacterium]|nr:lipoyl(octanoyl) transferase LipB [Candidatus Neomarinimicrobiota bacterium]MDP7122375.1 lipoyl(octanoyl) transferase LipB [Candidatus Neomarinimicrobiota bacterium]MDP7482933.1 lipoyl(octanoyl) transferase LipB [Candidatus Neomarinimicrobiota bacterium]MDP7528113.1 lipoyl(octanoyl) transferase LipB [Candidatus Neomarinimicrobiota bacterium]MDP7716477.1 lipoyl(octanoyl) transferase LipB [Candidatus Neomarinimicrobiota bacterium]
MIELTDSSANKSLDVIRLGRKAYEKVWDRQKKLVDERRMGIVPDTLILVEHDPVYTLGKNSNENHLLKSRDVHIPVYQIERGGDVTFHGPGQLVGYPILDLHHHRLSVSWYMRTLEEMLIRTVGQFGIEARRREGLTGVWVGEEKIAALGVRLSRWVSMHGFALNVNTDLEFFDGIIPCGIFEYDVTSMSQILGKEVSMVEVEETLVTIFRLLFSFQECEAAHA